ncbi:hypothetical protein JL720_17242 [Aureococcus anophagefferens]|nr:hypothetical protein JL720_17242 [Aureococcus anophagefferens]
MRGLDDYAWQSKLRFYPAGTLEARSRMSKIGGHIGRRTSEMIALRGVAVVGPHGVGKAEICKDLANTLMSRCVSRAPSDFGTQHENAVKAINHMFGDGATGAWLVLGLGGLGHKEGGHRYVSRILGAVAAHLQLLMGAVAMRANTVKFAGKDVPLKSFVRSGSEKGETDEDYVSYSGMPLIAVTVSPPRGVSPLNHSIAMILRPVVLAAGRHGARRAERRRQGAQLQARWGLRTAMSVVKEADAILRTGDLVSMRRPFQSNQETEAEDERQERAALAMAAKRMLLRDDEAIGDGEQIALQDREDAAARAVEDRFHELAGGPPSPPQLAAALAVGDAAPSRRRRRRRPRGCGKSTALRAAALRRDVPTRVLYVAPGALNLEDCFGGSSGAAAASCRAPSARWGAADDDARRLHACLVLVAALLLPSAGSDLEIIGDDAAVAAGAAKIAKCALAWGLAWGVLGTTLALGESEPGLARHLAGDAARWLRKAFGDALEKDAPALHVPTPRDERVLFVLRSLLRGGVDAEPASWAPDDDDPDGSQRARGVALIEAYERGAGASAVAAAFAARELATAGGAGHAGAVASTPTGTLLRNVLAKRLVGHRRRHAEAAASDDLERSLLLEGLVPTDDLLVDDADPAVYGAPNAPVKHYSLVERDRKFTRAMREDAGHVSGHGANDRYNDDLDGEADVSDDEEPTLCNRCAFAQRLFDAAADDAGRPPSALAVGERGVGRRSVVDVAAHLCRYENVFHSPPPPVFSSADAATYQVDGRGCGAVVAASREKNGVRAGRDPDTTWNEVIRRALFAAGGGEPTIVVIADSQWAHSGVTARRLDDLFSAVHTGTVADSRVFRPDDEARVVSDYLDAQIGAQGGNALAAAGARGGAQAGGNHVEVALAEYAARVRTHLRVVVCCCESDLAPIAGDSNCAHPAARRALAAVLPYAPDDDRSGRGAKQANLYERAANAGALIDKALPFAQRRDTARLCVAAYFAAKRAAAACDGPARRLAAPTPVALGPWSSPGQGRGLAGLAVDGVAVRDLRAPPRRRAATENLATEAEQAKLKANAAFHERAIKNRTESAYNRLSAVHKQSLGTSVGDYEASTETLTAAAAGGGGIGDLPAAKPVKKILEALSSLLLIQAPSPEEGWELFIRTDFPKLVGE